MQPRVLIIGFGLMGGSAGLALRARGWHVSYVDDDVPFEGKARYAADEKLATPRDEEIVLLATPIDPALEWLPKLRTRGVITSLCSLMKPLRDVAPRNFVAAHPMAGSHLSGIENASRGLYCDKVWFLERPDDAVERLIRDCGAIPRVADPEKHDAMMALTSQLPQVLSTALAAYLNGKDVVDFAGSGLRDFLRLAGSNVEMWKSILRENKDTLAPHADAIASLVHEIITGDPSDAFGRANTLFKSLT